MNELEVHLKNFLKNIYRTAMTSPIEQAKNTGINFDITPKMWYFHDLLIDQCNDIVFNLFNKILWNYMENWYQNAWWLVIRNESGKYF